MNIPKELADYLQEQLHEGKEIIFTHACDENVAIILEAVNGEDWVMYCSWMDGGEEYSLCNITGTAWETLKKLLNNGGKI